jgi:hypothetical protein
MTLKNLLLVFLSLFFFLIIIEVILRLKGDMPRSSPDFTINEPLINIPDPKLGWVPKKEYTNLNHGQIKVKIHI